MTPVIFLSYAREDALAVQGVYSAIRKANLRPWMDKPPIPFESDGIPPGLPWKEVIRTTLESAHLVLAFFSARSVAKQGYVQREYRMALDLVAERPVDSIFLVPVLLEPCDVPDLTVGTIRLRDVQFFNMFERGSDELVALLSKLIPPDNSAVQLASLTTQLKKALATAKNHRTNIQNRKRLRRTDPDEHAVLLRRAEEEVAYLEGLYAELQSGGTILASVDKRVNQLAAWFKNNYEAETRKIDEAVERERLRLIGTYSQELAARNREAAERRDELEREIIARATRQIDKPSSLHYYWFRDVPSVLKTKTQWKKLGRLMKDGAVPCATVSCKPLRRDIDLFDENATQKTARDDPA